MAAHAKKAQQLARQLFRLSVVDGTVSSDRVAGVLGYLEKRRPANPLMVLKAYRRLVSAEVARGRAIIEHAGPASDEAIEAITAAMSRRYGRRVTAAARPNSALLAGMRVRIGDDVYETSVAGQLAALSSSL